MVGARWCAALAVVASLGPVSLADDERIALARRVAHVVASPPKLFMYPKQLDAHDKVYPLARRKYWELETQLWGLLPENVWTTDPNQADFFVFPHTFFGHWEVTLQLKLPSACHRRALYAGMAINLCLFRLLESHRICSSRPAQRRDDYALQREYLRGNMLPRLLKIRNVYPYFNRSHGRYARSRHSAPLERVTPTCFYHV